MQSTLDKHRSGYPGKRVVGEGTPQTGVVEAGFLEKKAFRLSPEG